MAVLIANPVCIFISHVGGKLYSGIREAKNAAMLGVPLRLCFVDTLSCIEFCGLWPLPKRREGTAPGTKWCRIAHFRQIYEVNNLFPAHLNFS